MGISADETNFFHGMTMMTMLIEGRNLSSSTRKNSFKLKPVTLNRKSLSKTEEKNAEGKCSGASWWWKQIMGQPFLFHGPDAASNGNRQRLLSISKKVEKEGELEKLVGEATVFGEIIN